MAGVLDQPAPIAIAHRGGGKEAPENSMLAFQCAYDLGFRWFETDVQATAEGQLVLVHDRHLQRRLRDGPVPQVGDEVRLHDLFAAFPDVVINVDPKHDAAAPLLAHFLTDPRRRQRVCVASFDYARMRWLRAALGPQVATALTPREVGQLAVAARRGRRFRLRGHHAVQVPTGPRWAPLVEQRLVAAAHAAGMPVHVWTVDSPDEMNRLLDLGVDAIMTDRPSVLRDVLQRRSEPMAP